MDSDVKTSTVTTSQPSQMLTVPPPPDSSSSSPSQQLHEEQLTKYGVAGVKLVTLRLLCTAVERYHEEICYECQVKRPIDKNHGCMQHVPEFFYGRHYDEVMKRFWSDRLIPAIRLFLWSNSLDDARKDFTHIVVAQASELKDTINIIEAIESVGYELKEEYLFEDLAVELLMVENYWLGKHRMCM